MDKLKGILKHQFWILLGVALVLPLVGWSVARSGLVRETDTRWKALDGLWAKVDTKPDDPNADWEQKVKEINGRQKTQLQIAWEALYQHQKQSMTWPAGFNPEDLAVAGDTEMESRELYSKRYDGEWRKVYRIPRPIDPNTSEGKVAFDEAALPSMNNWGNQPPTPEYIHECQEDLWLYRSILESIAFVNADANSQVDAPIRVIWELYLRGGSKGDGGDTGGGGGGDTTGYPAGGANALMDTGLMGGFGANDIQSMMKLYGGGGSGAASGEGAFSDQVKFDPNDELGPEVAVQEEGAESADVSADPIGLGTGMLTGMTGFMTGQKMDRYVEKKPEWKTRGFYLEVVMDHRKVPNLLVALTNAGERWGFAIRISRVHQADFREEDMISAGGAVGGMAGMKGMGAGGVGDLAAMAAAGGLDPSMLAMASSLGLGGLAGAGMGSAPSKPAGPAGMDMNSMLSFAGSAGVNITPEMMQMMGQGGMSGVGTNRGRTNINRMPNLGMGAEGLSPGARAIDPLSDPMLANVAIDGWLVILNPPTVQEPVVSPDQSIEEPLAGQEPEAEAGAAESAAEPAAADAAAPAEDLPAPTDDEPAVERDADNRKED